MLSTIALLEKVTIIKLLIFRRFDTYVASYKNVFLDPTKDEIDISRYFLYFFNCLRHYIYSIGEQWHRYDFIREIFSYFK